MAIDEEASLSASALQELSVGLAAVAAANAERLLPSGADKEMKKLSESVQQIPTLLKDAKVKKRKELEDIVSDILSILQVFFPKATIDQISQNRRANSKIAMELKDIRLRLDKILKKPQYISLQHRTEPPVITKMAIRHSPLETLNLSGKNEEDQQKIIDLLLSVKETRQAGPSVIPIDGKGATGTTKLAEAIFNDKRVTNHFTRRIWMNASEIIDSDKLSRLIHKPAGTIFWVHKTLDNNLEEEHVLLILDDIRNKNVVQHKTRWIKADRQKKPWMRVDSTAEDSSHKMERLSEEESWILFKEHAFASGDCNVHRKLEEIGRNIVKNLEGSRPMIEKIGCILASSLEPSYWKLMLESQVWKLPVDEELSQPTLAELCYHPSLRCQNYVARCSGSEKRVPRVTYLFWKRQACVS